jgi:uncharacterized protein YkwD
MNLSIKLLFVVFLPLVATSCAKQEFHRQENIEMVRFRPINNPSDHAAATLLRRVPDSTWDAGLARATSILTANTTDRLALITPSQTHTSQGIAGYPGHARFIRTLNAGEFPDDIAEALTTSALRRSQPVDVAISSRSYGDGVTLWVAGIAHRPLLLDPIARDVELDTMVPVSIEAVSPDSSADQFLSIPDPILFVSPPSGPVKRFDLSLDHARWIDGFVEPGQYGMEVVAQAGGTTQVLLQWQLFVETEPPNPRSTSSTETTLDPIEATNQIYEAVNTLRVERGLHELQRFRPFEPLAREHAAFMAHTGVVDHTIAGVTEGVSSRTRPLFHPGARHRENLAAASNWQDALNITTLSPGHLDNLLCLPCTHLSVGVAYEPAGANSSRIFVVWEMLEFPQGIPTKNPEL